jgi:hypothetical protein
MGAWSEKLKSGIDKSEKSARILRIWTDKLM